MKFILTCILLVFVVFVCSNCIYFDKLPEREIIANKITAKTAKQLEKQTGFALIGTGGSMMDDVKMMMMAFQSFDPVDMAAARKLIVQFTREYLAEINANVEIRPYLHEYPFTDKGIEIQIFFTNQDWSRITPNKISVVSKRKKKIYYYIDCPEKDDPEKDDIEIIHEETFEEACKIVDE